MKKGRGKDKKKRKSRGKSIGLSIAAGVALGGTIYKVRQKTIKPKGVPLNLKPHPSRKLDLKPHPKSEGMDKLKKLIRTESEKVSSTNKLNNLRRIGYVAGASASLGYVAGRKRKEKEDLSLRARM